MQADLVSALSSEILAIRQRCKDDIFFLGAEVLGYDYLANPAPFHREAATHLGSDVLFLAPRNHIKTTLYDVVGTVHHLICFPDDRILLAASTWDNAKLVLREVVGHFRGNELFRKLFPEFCPQGKSEEGNTEEFTVPCRTRPRKEASIETCGQDRVITGRHYDVIRCTDLVVRENVPPAAAPEQMQRTIEWFRTTSALLDTTNPRAHRTVDGTRWHDADLYGEMLRGDTYKHFKKVIIGIQNDENGEPISVWGRMPKETLLRLRNECGSYLWAANYKNDPVPGDGVGFRREWFKTYDKIPDIIEIAITVDLAISDKPGADRTAIVVAGVTPNRDLYVLATRYGRWSPYETIEHIYELDSIWNPSWVGVETTAFQKVMWYMLHEESRKRNHSLPLRKLVADQRKDRRAFALISYAERGGIFVRPEHEELVDECCRFPAGRHDDLVDALAYRVQDMYSSEILQAIVQRPDSVPGTSKLMGSELLTRIEAAASAELELPWDFAGEED